MSLAADLHTADDRPLDSRRGRSRCCSGTPTACSSTRATSGRPRLAAWGGDGFAEALFAAEVPALRGEVPFREALAELLARWPDVTAGVDDLLGPLGAGRPRPRGRPARR